MPDYPQPAPDLEPNRFYRGREVAALLGVQLVTIYGWMKAGKFPRPHRVGPRTVRWTGRQIIEHLNKSADSVAPAGDWVRPW
ncbi:MAG: AlpA family phage regulatory protein [Loktanella sp.]|nr:AlpA family phage regulatory protein [Loktanella sp.]